MAPSETPMRAAVERLVCFDCNLIVDIDSILPGLEEPLLRYVGLALDDVAVEPS